MLRMFCLTLAVAGLAGAARAEGDPPQDSTVFVQTGYFDGNVFTSVENGSGFIANRDGWIVTAKHVVDAEVPANKVKVFFGAVASRFEQKFQLFDVAAPVVSADVALLRISPAIHRTWPYLKVVANHKLTTSDRVTAVGYPLDNEITVTSGTVANLLGPKGLIGVDMNLAPGMSGGPVLLGGSRCVIGIVAAGAGSPFNYFAPVQYAKPLLDLAPVEYVDQITTGIEPPAIAVFDRSYQIDQTKDDHHESKNSQYYEFTFEADPGAKVVSARLAENSAASVGDKTINISPDRTKATFRFQLMSGPFWDQTRGWWHGQLILTQQREEKGSKPGTRCD